MGATKLVVFIVGSIVVAAALYVGISALMRWLYLGSRPGPKPVDFDKDKEA